MFYLFPVTQRKHYASDKSLWWFLRELDKESSNFSCFFQFYDCNILDSKCIYFKILSALAAQNDHIWKHGNPNGITVDFKQKNIHTSFLNYHSYFKWIGNFALTALTILHWEHFRMFSRKKKISPIF